MVKPDNLDVLGQLAYDVLNDLDFDDIVVHSDLCNPDILPKETLFRPEFMLFEVEEVALKHLNGRVLDVGSGFGSISQIVKSKGFEVEGIDTSQGAVDYQEEIGLKAKCVDFFEFEGENYDTILMMMNGIGIVGTMRRMPEFFQKLDQLLSPNGKALIDSSDIAYLYENEDGSIYVNLDQDYYGEMKYQMQYKENYGEWFDWLYIDFETLSKLADENGFTATQLFEDNNNHYLAELKRK
ncbi:MAG: methyltransferase domain-containing protein [Crocinitomicaceae bacterium]|nr:methyltransferase domain-containing protein [Crocinitomicaceae bacterium]